MPRLVGFISYGQGGKSVDVALGLGSGIDLLHRRVVALGVESARPRSWHEFEKIAGEIQELPPDAKVVIGGTSLGANMAPWIAATVYPRPIELIFGVQPSLYGTRNPISKNVRRALCIYNPNWFLTLGLGGYQWERAPNNHQTVLVTRTSYASHPGINVASVQEAVLAEIRGITGKGD